MDRGQVQLNNGQTARVQLNNGQTAKAHVNNEQTASKHLDNESSGFRAKAPKDKSPFDGSILEVKPVDLKR